VSLIIAQLPVELGKEFYLSVPIRLDRGFDSSNWALITQRGTKQPHPPLRLELQLVNAVGMYAEWLDAVSFTCRPMQPFPEESHLPASSRRTTGPKRQIQHFATKRATGPEIHGNTAGTGLGCLGTALSAYAGARRRTSRAVDRIDVSATSTRAETR